MNTFRWLVREEEVRESGFHTVPSRPAKELVDKQGGGAAIFAMSDEFEESLSESV
jgi:hypothetical protein